MSRFRPQSGNESCRVVWLSFTSNSGDLVLLEPTLERCLERGYGSRGASWRGCVQDRILGTWT
jgi:hypothetical protein